MKTLITFQLIAFFCSSSSKDQISSSKQVIDSKDTIEDIVNTNPLDKIMEMPTFEPIPLIINPSPVTDVNP
jgi:hypothetical protein